jgi:hypothetical protein
MVNGHVTCVRHFKFFPPNFALTSHVLDYGL